MKTFATVILTLSSGILLATIHPGYENLKKRSHLVVKGSIVSITQSAYTGVKKGDNAPKLQLNITVKIQELLKGRFLKKNVVFGYPAKWSKGHLFKECVEVKVCKNFSNEPMVFYLFKMELDERYSKYGAKGFMLTDGWFGIQKL